MTPRADRPDDGELHAYVDGRMAPERRAAVEAWLADDADLAAAVAHYRAQNEALHALYDPLLERPMPDLLGELALRRSRRRARLATAARAAAVVVLMAASATGGWYARPLPVATAGGEAADLAFAEAGVSAHRVYAAEVRHAVEVPVSEEEHLTRWLSKRLDAPLRIPDLTAQGYTLMGGRLLPAGGLPAAHFLYETKSGERLTLYMQPNHDRGATSFRFAAENGVSAVFWREGRLAYAVIGPGSREDLLAIANATYRQLNP
jgi:anti-sigma factor RsiW